MYVYIYAFKVLHLTCFCVCFTISHFRFASSWLRFFVSLSQFSIKM